MESLNDIFAWISGHPAWGGAGVFLIAFFESLVLVGLILPGAAMMFGIGALVGTGILPLDTTLLWAAAGAITGDGVSFWLGRRYHMRLKTLWPLRSHPELIANTTRFFHRHGGKSILFGRFIGPIRPVIPAVAGMLEMPTRRFILFNVISGILWAPVYVLPGMIFTTSLGLAAEVASRLAVTAGSLMAALVLLLWSSRLAFNWLHRTTYPLMQRLLWWSRLHPFVGRIPASLLDPEQPESRGLTWLALLLLVASVLFSMMMATVGDPAGILSGIDYSLHHTLHNLRTPVVDAAMLFISRLGDLEVILTLSLLILLWLLRNRLYRAALHWLAAIGFSGLLGAALFALGRQLSAEPLIHHATDNAQLLSTIACLGFLAILIAREVTLRHRWIIYALASALCLAIALSRVYLGLLHLGSILVVIALATAWVALLGIGYRNHPAERVPPLRLAMVAAAIIAITMAWHAPRHWDSDLASYSYQEEPVLLSPVQWSNGDALGLPRFRADLRGRHTHPLNLQFSGPLAQLQQRLLAAGWQIPPEVTATSWLLWLNPATPLAQMPVLPQVHDGRYHELLLTRQQGDVLMALRLWRSRYRVGNTPDIVWLGNVSELRPQKRGGLTVPRTQENFATLLQRFLPQLRQLPGITLQRAESPLRFGLSETHPPGN